MPFKKLPESKINWFAAPCVHPEHKPFGTIVLKPGTYEYTCPQCHAITYVTIPPKPRMKVYHGN